MKKLSKILTPMAAILAAALFFAGCKQFLEDPEDFFSYWAAGAVIDRNIVISPAPSYAPGSSIPCVPSAGPVTVTMKVHNPRNFTLVMPTSSADAGKVIYFPGLSTQPVYGTDYTLDLTANDTLKLTYTQAFLQAHEWSNGDIGPEITLISTDGRKFSKKFSLNIEANTPPPEIGDITIAKTKTGGMYVLHFKADNMTALLGSALLHKDIAYLNVQKEGGTERKIPISAQSSQFNTSHGGPFLLQSTDVDPLIDTIPSGNWELYVKTATGLTESTLPTKYTVRLIDEKGLSSVPKEAKTLGSIPDISDNTKAWKNLKQAVADAQEGGVITVMGNVKATNDPDNNGAIDVTKSLTIKGVGSNPALDANQSALGSNAHRIFTVTGDKTEFTLENLTLKNGYANPGGLLDYRYGGAISASQIKTLTLKNCVIEDCKAYGGGGISLNGGVEAVLERCTITGCQTTRGGGGAIYAGDSSGKQPVVRIKGGLIKNNTGYVSGGAINISRGSLYIEKYENDNARIENNTVIASGGGGNGGGGISYYWDADKPGKLTIENAEITNCNIEYNSSGDKNAHGAGISVYGNGDVSLSNVTLNRCEFTGESLGNEFGQKQGGGIYLRKVSTATIEDCTIKNSTTTNEGGGIYAVDSNLTIEDTEIQNNKAQKKGGGLYVLAAYADVNLTIKGTTQFDGNDVNLTSGDPWGGGIYMKGNSPKSVTAVMTGGEVLLNEAYDGGGIYIDSNASFTMTGGLLTGNDAQIGSGGKGSGVYLAASGTFTMSGSAKIKSSDDVYLSNGTMITLSGRLSEYFVARITPENYSPSTQVLDGDITAGGPPPNYMRFEVTPKDLGGGNTQDWVIDENGYLR
ncbi:right-handed parallel beta-helix repeat-containing protein [Treponema denticola]|uniref:right-handed parallel beta-helix repeat-containing protein n=1 Tax=Treponema denticola TaxID=158 RepID=UPI002102692F|nr:right-handed parallel beta-helix repeat-containing protein [Treponema denticola]UTY24437.1 hypothetical protein E4N78_10140 [Treponema denticola]